MNLVRAHKLNDTLFKNDPLDRRTINSMCKNKDIPAHRIGKFYFVDLDEVTAFIKKKMGEGQEEKDLYLRIVNGDV